MNVTIPCVCPPLSTGAPRHDDDTITLRDKLSFRAGLTVRNTIIVSRTNDPDASVAEILAMLTEVYLFEGIEAWSLVDQRNKAVEVSRQTVRAFMEDHPEEAMTVGNEADGLYVEAVMNPLVRMASQSSPRTRTNGSTSLTTGSEPGRPKRSRRSSTSTTPTDGTTTMYASRGGGSN